MNPPVIAWRCPQCGSVINVLLPPGIQARAEPVEPCCPLCLERPAAGEGHRAPESEVPQVWLGHGWGPKPDNWPAAPLETELDPAANRPPPEGP